MIYIEKLAAAYCDAELEAAVCEWYNCGVCVIEAGSVWVATPSAGHFLTERECRSFYHWFLAL